MMIARKSIDIVLVISLLVVFGCAKEKKKTKSFPQTYPEGVPKEIVSEKDKASMVLIPAGEFMMGTSDKEKQELMALGWWKDTFNNEQPEHPVYLDEFYIDKYEVTNAQYAEFLNAYGQNVDAVEYWFIDIENDYSLIEKVENVYKPKAGYENYSVVYVSWYGAGAYAQFYGKRLPTEAEWEKAARGGWVGKKYPWGDSKPDGRNVNFADKNTDYYWSDKTVDDGYERTAPVGSYQPNGYGLYDMAGNAWEWVADEYDSDYYSQSPKNNPKGPGVAITFKNNDFVNVDLLSWGLVRGGGWVSTPDNLRCARRRDHNPAVMYDDNGFRCAQDL